MEISDQPAEDSRPESTDEELEVTPEQDVAVRAAIAHQWRGENYARGEEMPVTEQQGKKLVAVNLAYYDSGDKDLDVELTQEAIDYQKDCGCG